MNQFEYLFGHAIPTGWQTVRSTFNVWKDLMTNNFDGYKLLKDDDPFKECYEWFWQLLGEDNVIPKSFLEHLQEIIRRIDAGEEKLIYFNLDDDKTFEQIMECESNGNV